MARAISHVGGHDAINIWAVQMRLGISHEVFAHSFCFSVSRVDEWKQERGRPESSVLFRGILHDNQVGLVAPSTMLGANRR